MLDKGEPFVNSNIRLRWIVGRAPLLCAAFFCLTEKIYLLLKRGAEVRVRDKDKSNCLHLIFDSLLIGEYSIFPYMDESKDALMCLVTAGADVDACNKSGESVSEAAFKASFEGLWIEVLAECGYDPEPFLRCLDHHYHRKNPGFGAFAAKVPKVRSARLSFAEYGKQRKPRRICSRGESLENFVGSHKRIQGIREFLKLIEEDSEDEDGDNYDGEVDIYSTEHGAEWWL